MGKNLETELRVIDKVSDIVDDEELLEPLKIETKEKIPPKMQKTTLIPLDREYNTRVLRKDINGVGDSSEEITFSLTDDSTDAHFIFTDSTGKNKYGSVSVQTKGYYNEKGIVKSSDYNRFNARLNCPSNSSWPTPFSTMELFVTFNVRTPNRCIPFATCRCVGKPNLRSLG